MPRKKISNKKPGKRITDFDEVFDKIFSVPIPKQWRKGQFVFNRASGLYGDNFVRSLGHDPFYNDANIVPFIEALTESLNKAN